MTTARASFGDFTVGDRVADRFEIIAELGRGGHSVVYSARDHLVGIDVALKVLVPPPIAARAARERLKREVQFVRALRHEHIVGIHDFIDDGQISMVVMDLIDGQDLARLLARRGALTMDEVVTIGAQIAAALVEAHRAGILHRDIKPANILIDRGGKAWLTDFGSARLDSQATITQTGGLVGTVGYLAPEVWSGGRADARADLYSLGVTLYEAVTGKLPLRRSPHLPPSPEPHGFRPAGLRPELPPWFDQAIAMTTTADPRHRFATARQLADLLSDRQYPTRPIVDAMLSSTDPANQAAPRRSASPWEKATVTGVVLFGATAGWLVSRGFYLTTPLVAWLLSRAIRRSLRSSSATGDDGIRRWPIGGSLAAAIGELAAGPAREQLDDILIVAQLQVDGAPTAEMADQWRRQIGPLVETAVQVAQDLDRVDQMLHRLERGTAEIRFVPAGIWDRLSNLEQSRDALSTLLLEALGALGRFRETTADDTRSADHRLRELLQETHDGVERHLEAATELETLFQKPHLRTGATP